MKSLLSVLFSLWTLHLFAQLQADAGPEVHLCSNLNSVDSIQLGGNPSATGGIPPYTYEWIYAEPIYPGANFIENGSYFLSDTSSSNPYTTSLVNTSAPLILKVTDSAGSVAYDSVYISSTVWGIILEGKGYTIHAGDSVQLIETNAESSFGNLEIIWRPQIGLTDSIGLGIWAKPMMSTGYYTFITDSMGCTLVAPPYYYITVIPAAIRHMDKESLRLFPTPVSTKLIVEGSNLVEGKFSITNISGKIIREGVYRDSSFEIDVTDINPGTYVITFDQGRELVTRRFVKR